jgi:hypothetical protein
LAAAALVESGVPTGRRRWTRRWPPAASFLIGMGFAVWGARIGIDRLSDNSFFTHLATGRLILEHGVPRHDPYSSTANGQPWVVQSWLASVVYAWIESWFGANGIRLLMASLTATLGALAWRLTRPARALIGRLLIAGCVLGVGASVWSPRPLLFGLVFLALTLTAAEKGLDPRWLVPIFWLWVNTHGSFPLGLVLLACLWAGRRLDGRSADTELRCLLWAALGTALGALNPLGPMLLFFPARLLGRMDVLRQIIEWRSPSFSNVWDRLFLVQVMVAIVALVRRPRYRAAIPLVVFTAAALMGVRNIGVASLVLVPGMARGLVDLGTIRGDRRSRVMGAGVIALTVVLVLIVRSALQQPSFNFATFPVDAVAWLDQNGLRRADVAMASPDYVGNYLELLDGTQARVFMDDRVDMYPKPMVDDFVLVQQGHPGWRAALDRHSIDLVLWPNALPLSGLMAESPDWRTLYQDATWTVTCRRGTALGGTGDLAVC